MKRICDVHSANHQIIGAITNDNRLSTEPSAFFLNHYKPEIIHDHDKLTVGRVTLPTTGSLDDRQLQVWLKISCSLVISISRTHSNGTYRYKT